MAVKHATWEWVTHADPDSFASLPDWLAVSAGGSTWRSSGAAASVSSAALSRCVAGKSKAVQPLLCQVSGQVGSLPDRGPASPGAV